MWEEQTGSELKKTKHEKGADQHQTCAAVQWLHASLRGQKCSVITLTFSSAPPACWSVETKPPPLKGYWETTTAFTAKCSERAECQQELATRQEGRAAASRPTHQALLCCTHSPTSSSSAPRIFKLCTTIQAGLRWGLYLKAGIS